jgi:DNA-binding NarL/FixJ family response regulator
MAAKLENLCDDVELSLKNLTAAMQLNHKPQPLQPLRLLIVDDQLMVRQGLRMLLERQPRMHVVGMASTRSEALDQAGQTSPDLILLDLELEGSAVDLVPELRAIAKNARILILTGSSDGHAHRQAVRLGASGVVSKKSPVEVLVKAIEKVEQGEVWLDRSTMGSVLREIADGSHDQDEANIQTLTPREREVITLIAEGLKNKQIAERLTIREATVTHHLSSIFSKLGVVDRLGLTIYAFGHGLAKVPNLKRRLSA